MKPDKYRVIGVDPGSRKVGVAVVEGDSRTLRPVAYDIIRLPVKENMVVRLRVLFDSIIAWVKRYQPAAAAIEDVFVRNNARSALVLGQARGVALLALGEDGVQPFSYAPATIKKAVGGHGRAGKDEIRAMVRLQLGLRQQHGEDAADALAVAMTHIYEYELKQKIGQQTGVSF